MNENEMVRELEKVEAAVTIAARDRLIDEMLAALRLVSGLDIHHSVLAAVDAAIAKAEAVRKHL
jgi:hypothetical protein